MGQRRRMARRICRAESAAPARAALAGSRRCPRQGPLARCGGEGRCVPGTVVRLSVDFVTSHSLWSLARRSLARRSLARRSLARRSLARRSLARRSLARRSFARRSWIAPALGTYVPPKRVSSGWRKFYPSIGLVARRLFAAYRLEFEVAAIVADQRVTTHGADTGILCQCADRRPSGHDVELELDVARRHRAVWRKATVRGSGVAHNTPTCSDAFPGKSSAIPDP